MKKLLIIIGSVFLVLGMAGTGFYCFIVRPSQKYVEQNKSEMLKISNEFITCLLSDLPETCGAKYGSTDFQKTAPPSQLELFEKKMQKDLGKMASSSINEKSLAWNTFTTTKNQTSIMINFQAKTIFEQDDSATIDFSFIKTPEWPLLLNSFRVNSNQMLK